MTRRPTQSEISFPLDSDSQAQAQEWARAASTQILDWTWRAFETLHDGVLSMVDMSQPLEQLERDLAGLHCNEITVLWAQETGGFSSLTPRHEYAELETRSPAPAKPPAYDFAFVWNHNPRVSWPIEAKVVPTPGTLAPYLADVAKFVNGTAAPFVGEGAQIAYLLAGIPDDFFSNLNARLSSPLQAAPEFPARPHRTSLHVRPTAPDLRLHHMAMLCGCDRGQIVVPRFDG